jgi:cytochrome P450
MTATQSLGELYDPFGAHRDDPYPFYARARREEPIFFAPGLGDGMWAVTRHTDVVSVLRDPEGFSSKNSIREVVKPSPKVWGVLAGGFPPRPNAITSDGEEHRRLRAPLARAFTPERIAALEPFIRERAEALVDQITATGSGADLRRGFCDPLPAQVITHVFGLDQADWVGVQEGALATVRLFVSPLGEDEQVELAGKLVAFQQLAVGYLRARRAEPRGDLTSELVAALEPGSGPLEFEQEARLVSDMTENLLAGHITTAALLANGVRHLLAHRDQWELLCQRPELLPGAIDEIARFDSSVPGLFRVATRPVTVGGKEFDAGTEFVVLFPSANRDETVFERPDEFDITRPPSRHVTFGFGPHHCAGERLARKELAVALETLTRRLPGLRLVDPDAITIEPMFNLRRPNALEVEW